MHAPEKSLFGERLEFVISEADDLFAVLRVVLGGHLKCRFHFSSFAALTCGRRKQPLSFTFIRITAHKIQCVLMEFSPSVTRAHSNPCRVVTVSRFGFTTEPEG